MCGGNAPHEDAQGAGTWAIMGRIELNELPACTGQCGIKPTARNIDKELL